jgi:hypothetical protein
MDNLNRDIPLNDTEEKTEVSLPLSSRRDLLDRTNGLIGPIPVDQARSATQI